MNKRSVLCLPLGLPGRPFRLSRMLPEGASPVLGRVSLIAAALVTAGLASCDSTAKFSLPDTKFSEVQVVSAFPAFIDPKTNVVTRVCGAPIDENDTSPSSTLVPNGLELVVNLVSTNPRNAACPNDRDLGIKEGEYIELQSVKTTGSPPTVGPQAFELQLACVEERLGDDPNAPCSSALGSESLTLSASAVRYQPFSHRCTDAESTHVSVALVIDNSGSTIGMVHKDTLLEDSNGKFGPPAPDLKAVMSDRYNSRVTSPEVFLDLLNDLDRATAYYFDENGVHVAASDSFGCVGGTKEDVHCSGMDDKTTCGAGGMCLPDDTLANDSFSNQTIDVQQAAAFGRMGDPEYRFRKQLKLGIEQKVRAKGVGRAPVWLAMDTAFSFMSANLPGTNRHIVLIADGPDTCTESEQYFNYRDLSAAAGATPKCRLPCAVANVQFATLLKKIADLQAKNDNVVIDVVQYQSPAKQYQEPDARMMELACRTNGTYQFINTSKFNRESATEWNKAFTGALGRVRSSLAGNWRPAFAISAMSQNDPVGVGKLGTLRGSLQFRNPKFASLATAYDQSESWRFGYSGAEDRRLLFRRAACASATDCGGNDECGANHCSGSSLCVATAAPDQLTCSGVAGTKRCCGGACATGNCKDACKL